MPKLISAVVLLVCFATAASADLVIDWATVGNAGNAGDVQTQGTFGAVATTYRISKDEVTNAQYTEFLNAVAGTDTHDLYNGSMGSDARGGISQACTTTCTYSIKPNMGDKPVNYVSFWDSARFANWMHNGQPMGLQGNLTTEDGAYTLGGVTNPVNSSVSRNAGASVFLPTEHEWYKAAYHKNDGVTGNYFDYPTSSDTAPSVATATATGDVSNPGANVANMGRGADWNGQDGNVTTVGSATSTSPYGTLDQAGNVFEWNETLVSSSSRGLRGGSWSFNTNLSAASSRSNINPASENNNVGFRVASVPEPSSLLCVGLVLLAVGTWKKLTS